MKTSLVTLLLAGAGLLSVQAVSAQEAQSLTEAEETVSANRTRTFAVNVFPTTEKTKMNVMIEKYFNVPLDIKVLDTKGNILSGDVMPKRKKGYWRKFDLNQLPDGVYKFQISNGVETITKEVVLITEPPKSHMMGRVVSIR